ncbi:MAG: type II toxin-antitoxin system Phd/YefM family antitoxin [Anaerolineae bacterium]|nr:type II toxin-antitoxin system Phd/YefM family antitoxin [Anaerolineae bacterium]
MVYCVAESQEEPEYTGIDVERGKTHECRDGRGRQLNLEILLERVIADVEPVIIIGESGDQTVLVSLNEFNAWQETLYLLASPVNADRLRRSINQMHVRQSLKVPRPKDKVAEQRNERKGNSSEYTI